MKGMNPRVPWLALLALAILLSACGANQTPPAPSTSPVPQLTVSCGTAENRDLRNELGVSAVVVKANGSAPLYSEPCVDQSKVLGWVPGGTNLEPKEARALFMTNANGVSLEFGIFYRVEFAGNPGWLFSEQLDYQLIALQQPIVAPTQSVNTQATTTANIAQFAPAGSSIPAYSTIGTPSASALGGARYVYLYECPRFDCKVVALVPPAKGAVVLLVKDNPGGALITKPNVNKQTNAVYHEGTWFQLLINHSVGWANASWLNIQ